MLPFEPADASFDVCPPIPAAPEPTLPLVRQSYRRCPPWSWQDDPFDTTLLGSPFICRRRQFAIAGDQIRWAPKLRGMLIQTWYELGCIIGIAVEHLCLGDDAALGLGQPEYSAKPGRLAGLALCG
jgi:hypothetical protein